jgi:peptidoglycan-N-acetylglucosamine deacetylase
MKFKLSHTFAFLLPIKFCVFVLFLGMPYPLLYAQDTLSWNHKKCAVSLTYDDALNVHLDTVIPSLDSLGLKATFYLSGYSSSLHNRLPAWRAAAQKGHELGNHTLFHPCEGKSAGREWVSPEYDLSSYTMKRMMDEIATANSMLSAIDNKTKRTFAYPCGDIKAGDSSYISIVQKDFAGARGVESKMQKIQEVDVYDIGAFIVNGQSGDELIRMVHTAVKDNSLLVFLFHGVGGEHSLNVSTDAHRALVHFLKQNEKDIWTAPLLDIVEYIKEHTSREK